MMSRSHANASTVPIFVRLSILDTFRPRRHATLNRSSPNRAGSTPTTRGPIPSFVDLRAANTSSGSINDCLPVAWNISRLVAGYSCLKSCGSFNSMILARRQTN